MILDNPKIIQPTLDSLKNSFRTGKTLSLSYRKQQLKNLLTGLKEMEDEIINANIKDMGYKNKDTSKLFNLTPTIMEIQFILKNFEKWSQKQKVDTSLLVGPGQSYIIPEPFGVSLVIGAWNYPLSTCVGPAANSIASGNCVVLKPSEMAPYSSNVIKKLIEKYLGKKYKKVKKNQKIIDNDCYRVIEGQIEVSKEICSYPWDHIIFTGSPQKGRLIAKAAAENLIPVILELGGKSPTIVDKSANLETAAYRIISGKIQNSGQTCIAPDYLYVESSIFDKFLEMLKKVLLEMTQNDPKTSPDYCRMINEFHTKRMQNMIKNHGGKLFYGGEVDVNQKYVQPTIIINPQLDSDCMKDEIFGPILPIFSYKNFDEVINFINSKDKPLALYYYGENKIHKQRLIEQTSSGALSFNESVMHYINHTLPFGGVGNSGYGKIHGQFGFQSCSHMKPVLDKSGFIGTLNAYPLYCRFPPYTESRIKTMNFLSQVFDIYPSEITTSVYFKIFIVLILAILLSLFSKLW
ncbi:hypothetical protein IMG5_131480 [Ichthyophthirius multifiliis]|uniref:Aldehyde dehydrogenase n=1 Tax=Ichthyophthirius multifiliis TaxID=5932 RepID=G0QWE7_ICHMU|nr:hypothetical protein IMG5_131480 [Ichthyophthirius multifiliis]EGR30464.1 hypothetical protein IMG5_131480 [Ichthyophthirius multifiliis]|eukprot:XP_004032051.1 hypothetical protein IMG5_131480 [Ichthyophthirius multifiliis]